MPSNNLTLSDAINAFTADRRARGFAAITVSNQDRYLRYLLADVGNLLLRSLRPQHLDIYWANRAHLAPGTRNNARDALRIFFNWCRARGYMPRDLDPMEGTRKARVNQRPFIIIPQAEFSTLLADIDNPRPRAAVAIGLYAFTRIGETQRLRWQDDLGDNLMVTRTKTGTVDEVPICAELREELDRWKWHYGAEMGEPVKRGWFLVPGAIGGHYGPGRVRTAHTYVPTRPASLAKVMQGVLTRAGYYQPYEGGHTLRRSGATALYNQLSSVGHDRAIRIVQAMLGHANITTTEIYLHLNLDRKVRDDLLAGKPMFPETGDTATIIQFQERRDGEEDARSI